MTKIHLRSVEEEPLVLLTTSAFASPQFEREIRAFL